MSSAFPKHFWQVDLTRVFWISCKNHLKKRKANPPAGGSNSRKLICHQHHTRLLATILLCLRRFPVILRVLTACATRIAQKLTRFSAHTSARAKKGLARKEKAALQTARMGFCTGITT